MQTIITKEEYEDRVLGVLERIQEEDKSFTREDAEELIQELMEEEGEVLEDEEMPD